MVHKKKNTTKEQQTKSKCDALEYKPNASNIEHYKNTPI